MAFITDKEELKPGLIIFRRGDVAHCNFYTMICTRSPVGKIVETMGFSRVTS